MIRLEEMSVEDIESIRLLLRGRSVIDWHRLDFRDYEEVYRFLRVNEFNPDSAEDMVRLRALHDEAIGYLLRTFSFPLPEEIVSGVKTRDLFMMASRTGPHQRWACIVLKVMHIVHHLAGRALAVRLPISDDTVFRAVELKVMQVVEELRAAGCPIAEFEWSRKPRDSLITKLLAKRSTLAAKIYDKLRFRLIVKNEQDLLPMLAVLTRQLVPFNYVVPETTVNRLVSIDELLKNKPDIERELMVDDPSHDPDGDVLVPENEFSGSRYRIVNFVADLPVRVDSLVAKNQIPGDCGHVVFVLTEFQLADQATVRANETGDASHEAYKNRQHGRVRLRLLGRSAEVTGHSDGHAPREPKE